MGTALLFDRDRVDEVEDWTARLPRLGRSAILWIDLEAPDDDEIARLIEKLVTLASVLFLPAALIAGVMGMNFRVGIFETAWYFWAPIAVIASVAASTLVVARVRRWI